ncbi:hypothetical protein SOASR030_20350 [Leminorella grimontii]|uniref:Uncharacterized protein n=1 Tax=Leminorella grimontii TaxID=82981 RepID=A0AAV5N329_9GAMM|nr:hypothetical protein SOASR030_20350 [Leminorella grimontii]
MAVDRRIVGPQIPNSVTHLGLNKQQSQSAGGALQAPLTKLIPPLSRPSTMVI